MSNFDLRISKLEKQISKTQPGIYSFPPDTPDNEIMKKLNLSTIEFSKYFLMRRKDKILAWAPGCRMENYIVQRNKE